MTTEQQQNEIIGDLTTKLALSQRSLKQLKDKLDNIFKFTNEDQLDDEISYLKTSGYFGLMMFKNRAKQISIENSGFNFRDIDLERQYKEMLLRNDFENSDAYITDLIPF